MTMSLCKLLKIPRLAKIKHVLIIPLSQRISRNYASTEACTNHSRQSAQNDHAKPMKSYQDIPGPDLHPWLLVLKNFAPVIGKYSPEKRIHFVRDLLARYGPLVRITYPGNLNIVHVFDPEATELVYRTEFETPVTMGFTSLTLMRRSRPDLYPTSPGISSLNGAEWWDLRRKVQAPITRPLEVVHYLPSVNEVANDLVTRIGHLRDEKSECPDFRHELYKFSTESIAAILFGARLGALKSNTSTSSTDNTDDIDATKIIKAVENSLTVIFQMEMGFQFFKYFKTSKYRVLERSQEIIAKITSKLIDATVERLKDIPEDSDERRRIVLATFLSRNDLELGDIIVTINDLLMAGIDTTSHAIGMLLYHLARNPIEQDKLVSQLRSVFPDVDTEINEDHLQEVPFLKACFKESLRLSPIVEVTGRLLSSDTVVSGYKIPAGTYMLLEWAVASKYGNHYKNQERFEPDRFLRSMKPLQKVDGPPSPHPFTTLPFGFGTRSCLGRRIAEMEVYVLMAKLIRRFRVEYHYEDIEMLSRFVNVPNRPFKFTFMDRDT